MYARAVALLSTALVLACASCGGGSDAPAALTSPTAIASPAASSLAEGVIAYAATDATIWTVNADGSNARQLIAEPVGRNPSGAMEAAHYASWSPDGIWIAYLHSIVDGPPTMGKLSSLNVSTGESRGIDDGVSSYQWISGGGRWVPGGSAEPYLSYQRGDEVWMSTASGEKKRRLFDWADPGLRAGAYSWSPDGRLLAYELADPSGGPNGVVKGYTLFVIAASDREPRQLDDHALISYFRSHAWSPDGRLLAYWKNEHGGSAIAGDICVTNIVSSSNQCLGQYTSDQRPQWAPDELRHIFQNSQVDPDNSLVQEVFPLAGAILSWAPDSSRLAVVEGQVFGEGPRTLEIIEAASGDRWNVDTSQADIPHAESPGYQGEWSPDGRYFAFLRSEPASNTEPAVHVADTQTHSMFTVLVDGAGFLAFSSDSSRLLIQRAAQPPEIWISAPDGTAASKLVDGVALFGSDSLAPWHPADVSR